MPRSRKTEDEVEQPAAEGREASAESPRAERPNPLRPPDQRSRHVMPLGPRVLVRITPAEDRSSAGLYLPPGAKDALARAAYGEVVEVARATPGEPEEGFGANVSGIPHGSRVLFAKDKGLPVPWDEDLRIVDVKDVLALVEEIDLEEAH